MAKNQTGNHQLTDGQFLRDTREVVGNQIESCARYRNIVGDKFSHKDIQSMDDLQAIVPVNVDLFKKSLGIFPELLNIPVSKIDAFVSSGGTGGDPSLVGRRNKEEIQDGFVYGIKTMVNNFAGLGPDGKWGKVYLSFPPHGFLTKAYRARFGTEIEDKPLVPYLDPIIEGLCPTVKPEDRKYMLEVSMTEGKPALVPLNVLDVVCEVSEYIKSGGKGPVFFGGGVQPFFYQFLVPALQQSLTADLGEMGMAIVGSGGWNGSKGFTNTPPIDKTHYIETVQKVLGIPLKNIADAYGTSENPLFVFGVFSEELGDFVFRPPAWSRILIRDPEDPEKVIKEPGKRGKPHIISPYGTESHAGASILVNDLFTPVEFGPHGECLAFTGIGRAKDSGKDGGCGDSAEQYIKG